MTNFAKMANLARGYQKFDKIYKEMTKSGILTNGDYNKQFAKIQIRWQTRHVDNCEYYKNYKFGKNL